MQGLFDQRRYLIPFRSSLLPQIFTDTLVIGAGVAGTRAAIAAAERGEVIVLCKGEAGESNTAWAQGGIAGVLPGTRDDVESHIRDTLVCGAGLCDEPIVRLVATMAEARIRELVDWGVRFDRGPTGELLPGREGGHSASRIYHANGDATGREMQRGLIARLRATSGVRLFEKCFTLDLITPSSEQGSPVMGAITHHPRFGLQMIWAASTILASGGAGMVYRETTNPRIATCDGPAMAYRAGATVADMAFTQFHPTTLYLPGAARSLISEAVRGEGAYLLDLNHQRFMHEFHPQAELAPRDIVSRAIVKQISKQGGRHVWLDCRHIKGFAARFPGITAELKRFDIDPSIKLIPVHPAAHYFIGGVRTDLSGRTDVPGLYAVGEAASSGLHGANRLASNSLLEGLVMGEIAGRAACEDRASRNGSGRRGPVSIVSDIRPSDQGELDLADVRSSLRSAMWRNVGIERAGGKLRDVMEMFDFWGKYTLDKIFDDPAGWETQNMLLAGSLMARSATWREESRGCHARSDHAESREEFAVHDCWRRGRAEPQLVPVAREVDAAGPGALA
ncbi:MAG: L-aspartate oxidase [Phycisphaeraceae bacterium]|nr:L-aspartate oxidase [Phycisphaeraceae bacterium]